MQYWYEIRNGDYKLIGKGTIEVPDDEPDPDSWVQDWLDVELHDMFPQSFGKVKEEK